MMIEPGTIVPKGDKLKCFEMFGGVTSTITPLEVASVYIPETKTNKNELVFPTKRFYYYLFNDIGTYSCVKYVFSLTL